MVMDITGMVLLMDMDMARVFLIVDRASVTLHPETTHLIMD